MDQLPFTPTTIVQEPPPAIDYEHLRVLVSEQSERVLAALDRLPRVTPEPFDYVRLESVLVDQVARLVEAFKTSPPVTAPTPETPSDSAAGRNQVETALLTSMVKQLTDLARGAGASLSSLTEGFHLCFQCGLANPTQTGYCKGCGATLSQGIPTAPVAEPLGPLLEPVVGSLRRIEEFLVERREASASPAPGLETAALEQSLADLTQTIRNTPQQLDLESVRSAQNELLEQVNRLTTIVEDHLAELKARKKGWFG